MWKRETVSFCEVSTEQYELIMITAIAQCRATEFMKHAQDANATALIYENILYGSGLGFLAFYANWEISQKDWHIHAIEISENGAIAKALKDHKNVTANITEGKFPIYFY